MLSIQRVVILFPITDSEISALTEHALTADFEDILHFFVDEKGLTQICIRESNGAIAEIQKRQQNGELPIPYIDPPKAILLK